MKRAVALGLCALALAALALRGGHGLDRLRASRLLKQVEEITLAALRDRRATPELYRHNLRLLEAAGELDPLEVSIDIARGSQFQLLGRADAARDAYLEALQLEARPTTYLNLYRVTYATDPEAAEGYLEDALVLAPFLEP